jgi:glycosyltransferase involved in cell wall biosynthesis
MEGHLRAMVRASQDNDEATDDPRIMAMNPNNSRKAPLRVLRVIARLNVGGPARHVVWLTTGLHGRGFETTLVTGSIPSGEGDMSYFAADHGVVPDVLPEMSREVSVLDLRTIWRLYRRMVHFHPDIVHTHTAKGGAVGRAAGLLYRWLTPSILWGRPRPCKFVHTFHGHVFHSYFGTVKTWLFRGVERLLARLATDRIVVISPEQYREIHEVYGVGRAEQFEVVPLGLETGTFSDWRKHRPRLRREWGAGEQDILVGIVGRLTEIKNHALFLQAAARYRASGGAGSRRVRFIVIGDGHLRPALEAQARALGLENDVVFVGQRDDPEDFYPALDIVALTSLNEGTPLTLLEAMANARPVIATEVGGVADVAGLPRGDEEDRVSIRERGILVPSQDAEAFQTALTRLIGDPALQRDMGERGEQFVVNNYARERLVDDIARLYEQLTGVPSAPRGIGSHAQHPAIGSQSCAS